VAHHPDVYFSQTFILFTFSELSFRAKEEGSNLLRNVGEFVLLYTPYRGRGFYFRREKPYESLKIKTEVIVRIPEFVGHVLGFLNRY
jgi:hypothetical protein